MFACEFVSHKKPGGLRLAATLSCGSLPACTSPGLRGPEPAQGELVWSVSHTVHSLEGNKLLRGHRAIPETKPGRDFSCEFPEREDGPNLKYVLAFCSVQEVDGVPRGSAKKQRHAGPSENLESGFGSCPLPPSPFSLRLPQGARHCWLSTVMLTLSQAL